MRTTAARPARPTCASAYAVRAILIEDLPFRLGRSDRAVRPQPTLWMRRTGEGILLNGKQPPPLSGGRMDLTAGRGYDRPDYLPFHVSLFDDNRSISKESLEVVRRLWRRNPDAKRAAVSSCYVRPHRGEFRPSPAPATIQTEPDGVRDRRPIRLQNSVPLCVPEGTVACWEAPVTVKPRVRDPRY